MSKPKISIIVPVYNTEKYLHHCLNSLIVPKQLRCLLEVLVVNDGSTDSSSTIAHKYEANYPDTFRVIDKQNGNYGSCINKGLEIATGKYIKVLDADDSFNTKSLEGYLKFLQSVDEDMIISPFVTVDEHGRELQRVSYDLPAEQSLTWKQLTPVFKKRSLQMHAVTYKTQNIRAINYRQTEWISYTDQEWIFTPLTTVNSAIIYPHVLYKYLVGRGGQTMNPKVFMKEISHEIQGWKANQSAWDLTATIGRGDAEQYLWYRLTDRAKVIYRRNILGCFTGYSNQELKDFDNYIKDHNRKLYDELEYATYSNRKFRFVHYWRKWHHYRPLVCLLLKIENKLVYWGYKYGGMH